MVPIKVVTTNLDNMKEYEKTINFTKVSRFLVMPYEVAEDILWSLDLIMMGGQVEHIICDSENDAESLYQQYLNL